MGNETTHFFGAFVDVEVRATDYELIAHNCVNGHKARTPFCPQCGQPVNELRIPQQRYTTDHYELLDDDLADTLDDTTPPEIHGNGHIVLRANQGRRTVWMEIDRHTTGEMMRAFPTDAEQEAMKTELMAFRAVKALQEHSQVVGVTVWCGYVEDSEY